MVHHLNLKLQKGVDFIGRDALLKQREEGVKRMYVQLLLEDHDFETDLWPWGSEPIYRNGKYVGVVTTAGYGFTFKKQVYSYSTNLLYIETTNYHGHFCRYASDSSRIMTAEAINSA